MNEQLGYAVCFRSGTKVWGEVAEDILEQMRGGFNPESLKELRLVFARRAGITDQEVLSKLTQINADSYLEALASHDLWTIKRVPMKIVYRMCSPTVDVA